MSALWECQIGGATAAILASLLIMAIGSGRAMWWTATYSLLRSLSLALPRPSLELLSGLLLLVCVFRVLIVGAPQREKKME